MIINMAGGIALFGGTFDPIHFGHLIAARAVAEHLQLDRVVLIPSANPPHKQQLMPAPAADRLEMARLAVEGDSRFEVSDIEARRSGLSYTILTVEEYRRLIGPDVPLYWIIGGDSLAELHTWYRVEDLVERCTVVTAVRPGFETPDLSLLAQRLTKTQMERVRAGVLPTPRIDISATDIRQRVRRGASIRHLTPESVRLYIERMGLYRADT